MKKAGILLLTLLILSIFVIVADAQTSPDTTAGGINEETGLPKSFDKYQEVSENLSKEEQREAYLKQEWTKIFANNKVLGPVLFYTNKFFTFLNPFWKIIFGVEFSWSWFFILSLGIWVLFIVIIYSPAKSFTNLKPLLALLFSAIISSIAGILGTIKRIVDFLTTLMSNRWIVWVSIIITILLAILYSKFMKAYGDKVKGKMKEEAEERREQKAKAVEELHDIELKTLGE